MTRWILTTVIDPLEYDRKSKRKQSEAEVTNVIR